MQDELTQIEDIKRRTNDLVAGLTPDQLTRRPGPTRWSITKCLEHLNVTGGIYVPLIEEAIRKGRDRKVFGKGPFNPGVLGRLLIWNAEPPPN
jgi:hypothetical protein